MLYFYVYILEHLYDLLYLCNIWTYFFVARVAWVNDVQKRCDCALVIYTVYDLLRFEVNYLALWSKVVCNVANETV